jgi:hypothetical protein
LTNLSFKTFAPTPTYPSHVEQPETGGKHAEDWAALKPAVTTRSVTAKIEITIFFRMIFVLLIQ